MWVVWRLRRYILLVAAYGKQCACGATQGWWGDNGAPRGAYMLFMFFAFRLLFFDDVNVLLLPVWF